MRTQLLGAGLIALAVMTVGACSDDPTAPDTVPAALLDVVPPGGATDVDPNEPVVIRFDHPIGYGMAEYAEIREGDMDGPIVPGAWEFSDDRTTLTFTPDEPLLPLTVYAVHLGGGMLDQHGHHLNFEQHGFEYGGEWCTEEQHGMGPMGPGPGMHRHGDDWRHPNGSYGMFFTFTTGV
jgi:hypothetical protein